LKLFGVDPRAHIEGPALFLSADAVQNIGFALHELATNACKHGSLTSPQGRVLVSWGGATTDGRIILEWVEQDGPAVQSPKHQGFGYLVITELVAKALQGAAKVEFTPDGIRWQLEFPASHVLNKDEALT
jgi:two-component sensor histidine kinase